MKKNFKVAFVGAIGAMLMLAGCAKDYSSDINALDDRVTTVESSVANLKSQIDAGAVITSVAPTANGVKVTLSNNQSFEITNGINGADGKDGSVIAINEDGVWTIDGVSTGLKAQGPKGDQGIQGEKGDKGDQGIQGEKGDKGDQGIQGEKGDKGDKGDTGAQGPKGDKGDTGVQGPKGDKGDQGVTGNYWMPDVANNQWVEYSFDGVATGKVIDKLLPESTITAVVSDGIVTFYNIKGAPAEGISFSTKKQIKGISFIADSLFDGKTITGFEYIFSTVVNKQKVFLGSTNTTVKFLINPTEVAKADKLEGVIKNSIVKTVECRADNAAAGDNNPVELKSISQDKNIITAKLASKGFIALPKTGQNNNMIALELAYDDETFTSDYAYVSACNEVSEFPIVHKDCKATERFDYRTDQPTISSDVDADLYEALNSPKLYWKTELNLNDYVDLWVGKRLSTLDYDGVVEYTFSFAGDKDGKFLGKDGATDQNAFVNLENGVMTVKDEYKGEEAAAAVNRTPLVKVEAFINGIKVSSAYIMVVITDQPADKKLYHRYYMNEFSKKDITKVGYFKFENLKAEGITKDAYVPEGLSEDENGLVITWDEINKQILAKGIDMTFEQFVKNYNLDYIFTLVNTSENAEDPKWEYKLFEAPEGIVLEKPSIPDVETSTNALSIKVTNEIYKNHKAPFDTIITLVYMANNNFMNYHVAFNFGIHVTAPETHNHPFKVLGMELNHDYLLGDEDRMHTPATPEPKAGYSPADDNYTKYAEVRIKGNSDDQTASDLIEHFEEYNFQLDGNCKNSTLSFLIKNYTEDQFKFIEPEENGQQYKIETVTVAGKKYSKITLTFAQLKDITDGKILSPKVKYVGKDILFGSARDVLMELEEICNDQYVAKNAASKKAYYYVQFSSVPVYVTVNDVVLRTYKDMADYVMIDTLAMVSDDLGKELFTYDVESGKWIATEYATETYGIDGNIEFKLSLAKDNTFSFPYPNDGQSTFGGHLKPVTGANKVQWENGGTDLQNDKHCKVNLVATVGGEANTIKTTAEVLILSTENTNVILAAEEAAKKAAEVAAQKAREEAEQKAKEEAAQKAAEFSAKYPWVKESNIGAAKYGYYQDFFKTVHHDAVEGYYVGNFPYGYWVPGTEAYDEKVLDKSVWQWWYSIDETQSNTTPAQHFEGIQPGTLMLED